MLTWLIILVATYLLVAVAGGFERLSDAIDTFLERHRP